MARDGPPLKVVRIIARLNIGGPARQALILNDRLRGRGFETLLVHGAPGEAEGTLSGEIERRGLRHRFIPALGRSVRPWKDLGAFAAVLRILFREQPDVVHTHTAKAGTVGRAAAALYNLTRPRRRRCAVIHTFHGHVFEAYFPPAVSFAIRSVERLLARASDVVIAISPSQKADLVDRFRIAADTRVRIVPLGLELDALAGPPVRAPQAAGAGAVTFAFVGRLVPVKNVPLLLDAFRLLAARTPGARLLLAGDGPLRPELEARVRALGLDGVVRFEGWCDDLAALYARVDAVVLSSVNEGTPVALIEAMAAGRPVVATAVGGVADIVEDRVTGFVVPPNDPEALARACGRLALDPGLRNSMGASARSHALARFGAARLVGDIDALYRSTLRRKRRGS